MQFLVILAWLKTERIEIGVQVTAHTIGADHHDSAHRVSGGAFNISGYNVGFGNRVGGFRLELVRYNLFNNTPVAIQR